MSFLGLFQRGCADSKERVLKADSDEAPAEMNQQDLIKPASLLSNARLSQQFVRDRFIPQRFIIQQVQSFEQYQRACPGTPYQKALMGACFPYPTSRTLVQQLPRLSRQPVSSKPFWSIPVKPYFAFEAPCSGDFYQNLIDWGRGLYCAIESQVFTVDLFTKTVSPLVSISEQIESIKCSPDLSEVAIGDIKGNLSIMNLESDKINFSHLIKPMRRLSCIDWLPFGEDLELTVAVGSSVVHMDRRQEKPSWQVDIEVGSGERVCSVGWNRAAALLAIGTNANEIKVVDRRKILEASPLYDFVCRAAVKGLQWNPEKKDLLMAGTGTADKHAYLINVGEGKVIAKENLDAQICDLKWIDGRHAVLGLGFGGAGEAIQVLSCSDEAPFLKKIKGLFNENCRVLNLAKAPKSADICSYSQRLPGDGGLLSFWRFEKTEDIEYREARKAKLNPFSRYEQVR